MARDRAATKRLLLRIEQTVDFVGERLHLARRCDIEPRDRVRDHVADCDPQGLQRRKANGDLDEERRHEHQCEEHEGRRKIADIFVTDTSTVR